MNMTNFAHAFEDLKDELRTSGSSLEELASEIAADYPGVNPVALVKRFNETFPEGLPEVDVEKAERLEKELKARQADYRRREAEAIEEFLTAPAHATRGGVRPIEQKDIHEALRSWPCRYETRDGRIVIGNTIGGLVQELRDNKVRVRTGFSDYEVRQLGVEVVEAQYIQGARPTGKFVKVAVLPAA